MFEFNRNIYKKQNTNMAMQSYLFLPKNVIYFCGVPCLIVCLLSGSQAITELKSTLFFVRFVLFLWKLLIIFLLFCELAFNIWRKAFPLCDLDKPERLTVTYIFNWIDIIDGGSKKRDTMEDIIVVGIWSIWRHQNDLIFAKEIPWMDKFFYNIVDFFLIGLFLENSKFLLDGFIGYQTRF